jgi:Ca2+-binding RTX toxin-like protein
MASTPAVEGEVEMGRRINVVLVVVAVMIARLVATPTASGAPAARAGACFGMAPTITGTAAGETINGTAGSDVIWAGGGNDTVFGLGGNDRICGAAGNDTINGGPGNDKINGGGGADSLFGNDGDDQLKGGKGNDTLSGIPGFDVDQAGTGTDACDLVDDVFGSCESYFGTFGTAATTLDIGLPAGQTLTLPQGWSGADPRTFNIFSGGSVSTSYLHTHPLYQSGDCTGFAIQAPDFEFTYTAGTPQSLLRFFWIPDTPGVATGSILTPSHRLNSDPPPGRVRH